MKKNIGLNTLLYFLYVLGSCVIVMLCEALLVNVIEKFVALPYPVLTLLRILIYTPAVPCILAVVGWHEGYREGNISVGATLISCFFAMIPHLLFAMCFKFQAFISGGVRFTAGLFCNGWDITHDSLINETPYTAFLLTFAVYGVLYAATLTISKYLGAQKRIIDRAALRIKETASSEDGSNGAGA